MVSFYVLSTIETPGSRRNLAGCTTAPWNTRAHIGRPRHGPPHPQLSTLQPRETHFPSERIPRAVPAGETRLAKLQSEAVGPRSTDRELRSVSLPTSGDS